MKYKCLSCHLKTASSVLIVLTLVTITACTTHSPPTVRIPISPPPQVLPSVNLPPAEPPAALAAKLSTPEKPQDDRETVRFAVVIRQGHDPTRSTVQSVELPKESTIVINIPLDATSRSTEDSERFRTKNYHNETEDSIQAALIRRGFKVKDRVKLEALSRDLRDLGHEFRDSAQVRNAYLYPDPAFGAAMSHLANRLSRGELSSSEYDRQVARHRSQLGLGLQVGDRRTNDESELVDSADLLRAAAVNATQADYILQVNRFLPREQKTSLRAGARINADF